MRVISQDGLYDVPYEKYLFGILNKKIVLFHETAGVIVIATYSTEEKAEKAFKKMNSHYKENICSSTVYAGIINAYKRVTPDVSDKIRDFISDSSVFQLPKDEEVV